MVKHFPASSGSLAHGVIAQLIRRFGSVACWLLSWVLCLPEQFLSSSSLYGFWIILHVFYCLFLALEALVYRLILNWIVMHHPEGKYYCPDKLFTKISLLDYSGVSPYFIAFLL